ncbi:unnamed protein product [Acanthoscelides obtectus]|uniref:SMP-LTD domain-containing protein n=1 Tax=Acanthoscelides obtectus TaxID=200917 RepID=A0A9P0QCL8_ACAOB|nr:unnamed protein product [Acanthoscelides obtectus]CAK1676884.1 Testis-expressed protein 2 [Acanthoscelides obtectus]
MANYLIVKNTRPNIYFKTLLEMTFNEDFLGPTCVEMSSDEEDTPSIDSKEAGASTSLRQRFRFLRGSGGGVAVGGHKTTSASAAAESEGTIRVKDLSKLYNINAEKVEQVLPEEEDGEAGEGVESAVDALQEDDIERTDMDTVHVQVSSESILKAVSEKYDNIYVDQENVVTVKEVTGREIREDFLLSRDRTATTTADEKPRTLFAPTGFVDFRPLGPPVLPTTNINRNSYLYYALGVALVCVYLLMYQLSPFFSGLAFGLMISFLTFEIYMKLNPVIASIPAKQLPSTKKHIDPNTDRILEIQAVKEYQPLLKYEGWVNEYPEPYDPETYHISKTQSVFVRLQGNLLRLSHAKNKVAKRAMWNEPEIKAIFTHHRIYNLIGAEVRLLPLGLAKKRHWSKKYPICIVLSKEQLYFDNLVTKTDTEKEKCDDKDNKEKEKDKEKLLSPKEKKSFGRFRRKDYASLAQRFSKLTEDEDVDLDSDSRASTPSADASDMTDFLANVDDESNNHQKSPNLDSLNEEWSLCSPAKEEATSSELKIYLFGRTDREKEDWFRRLSTATRKEAMDDDLPPNNNKNNNRSKEEQANADLEYIKFMSFFKSASKKSPKRIQEKNKQGEDMKSAAAAAAVAASEDEKGAAEGAEATAECGTGADDHVLWLNTLIGRVLFDCIRDERFIQKVKERIQRKLSTIKLPNFIEELLIPELSLGKTSPIILKAGKPVLDERGVWIDLDVDYEGDVLLTLQTKLNLMRLKNPQPYEKSVKKVRSAIYHSDVDDSAESSSDEDASVHEIPNLPQGGETVAGGGGGGGGGAGSPPIVTPSGGSGGKKFIKMVDRLTESKFFQAATDNRYIKKAMEGVSTELRLTVEVKSVSGTIVLNIPPPPSDRVWVGFRPLPEIVLSARPIVGERNISYFMVTSWIEKKLLQEFQKILVVPNMEDFIIPVMNPKLPE